MNRTLPLVLLLVLASTGSPRAQGILQGRAVLDAATFLDGPPSGAALDPSPFLPAPPFPHPPLQGVSALLRGSYDGLLALLDNGYGSRENSADFPLRWVELRAEFQSGKVTVLSSTPLRDPDEKLPFPIVHGEGERPLTGADLDPESFQQVRDGSFWVGEEFGPYLLHFDSEGRLLEPPHSVPLPASLLPLGRGWDTVVSPQHGALRSLAPEEASQRANHPASGGLEGLAQSLDGRFLLALLEVPLRDDPERTRLLLQEFSLEEREWTGRWWAVSLESEGHHVGALTALEDRRLLLVERDDEQGAQAAFKRIYRIELGPEGAGETTGKELVLDLLSIEDPQGITSKEEGAVGLGPRFSFPFVTIESLVLLNSRSLLLANDNNYPFSSGRRPGLAPDDTEFIVVRLPQGLR